MIYSFTAENPRFFGLLEGCRLVAWRSGAVRALYFMGLPPGDAVWPAFFSLQNVLLKADVF
jgi:hypothetical protein